MAATREAREITITYGGFAVGGDSRPIHDFVQSQKNFNSLSIQFKFYSATASSASAAKTEWDACEAAFRKKWQSLVISYGGSSVTYDPSDNTGFNAEPEIIKAGDPEFDNGRRRMFTVRITVYLPADNISTSGRRDSSVRVEYSPSRRKKVTISGEYTAVSSNGARAQYEAQIGTYASAVLTALSGTYELTGETASADDQDKTLQFERVYQEIIFSQGGANLDDSGIVEQSLVLKRRIEHPGFSNFVRGYQPASAAPVYITDATWTASIDKTVTTALKTKWDSVKSWVIAQAKTNMALATTALVAENIEFDHDENKIRAQLTLESTSFGNTISFIRTESAQYLNGTVLVPVWNGDPWAKLIYQGPKRLIQTVEVVSETIGDIPLNRFGPRKAPEPSIPKGKVTLIDFASKRTVKQRGQLGYQWTVTEQTTTARWESYVEVKISRVLD